MASPETETLLGVTAPPRYFTGRGPNRTPNTARIATLVGLYVERHSERHGGTPPSHTQILAHLRSRGIQLQLTNNLLSRYHEMFGRPGQELTDRQAGNIHDFGASFRRFLDEHYLPQHRIPGGPSPATLRTLPETMRPDTADMVRQLLRARMRDVPDALLERLRTDRALRERVRSEFITAAGGENNAVLWLAHASRGRGLGGTVRHSRTVEDARRDLAGNDVNRLVGALLTLRNGEVRRRLRERATAAGSERSYYRWPQGFQPGA